MTGTLTQIQFIDLKAQRDRVREAVERRWQAVVDHGIYIMGPEVKELEGALAGFTGAREIVTCSSGTDAVWLPLLGLDLKPGDAVFVPSWTFTATAEAICLCGASPVFVDVDPDTQNMDPESLKAAIAQVKTDGTLTPKAVLPVDLFGIVAPYGEINAIAHENGLTVVSDAAQSFGAEQDGRRVGTLADVTATSFFPAKPLGCWGDGGAIFTDRADVAEVLRSIRIHGRGTGKYDNVRVGTNARLDTLQAAVLLEKLAIFDDELARRRRVADAYSDRLKDLVKVPAVPDGCKPAWAQYTICSDRRDALAAGLKERGVPTQIYYPKPLHEQAPYAAFPKAPGGLPVTERLKSVVLSLPMHPYLDDEQVDAVCQAVRASLA